MTRRVLACVLAVVGLAGATQADEPRTVPAAGAKLTYRMVSTTKTPTKTVSTGLIYTYIVAKSDGTTAEGSIKPNAIILSCDSAGDLGCKGPAEAPGAHLDGNLLTVPVESASGDALAKQSYFKLVHFLLVSRKYPQPSSRDPSKYNLSDFGPDPAFILTNTLDCDLAGLEGFLPLGKSKAVTLPCETGFERSASRDGHVPQMANRETVTMDIAYQGEGWVTLPSGNWQVHKYSSKITPKDSSHLSSDSEVLFSTQLGVTVKYHLVGSNSATQAVTENTVELISVSP